MPFFEHKKFEDRLSKDDAEVVEVIHTNGGSCGIMENIGHLDFYPNGGAKQPGCIFSACAHSRAYELYAESINNIYPYLSVKDICKNYNIPIARLYGDPSAEMGGLNFALKRRSRGMFCLKTKEREAKELNVFNRNSLNFIEL